MPREQIIVELDVDGAVYTEDGKFIGHFPYASDVRFYVDEITFAVDNMEESKE